MHDPFDQRLPLHTLSLLSPFPPDVSFVLLLVPPQLSPAAVLTREAEAEAAESRFLGTGFCLQKG